VRTRRQFTERTVVTAAVVTAPAFLRGQNLNGKLKLALLGSSARGAAARNHPQARMVVEFARPAPSLPKPESHWLEWSNACKGKALVNFDCSGWRSEPNRPPTTDQFIRPEYRAGWLL
jgi:hypothetical protein